jgi:hypothetical protein
VVDDDARTVLEWMTAHGRVQDWRALDRNGKPRVYKRKVCEVSRNKLRVVLDLPSARFDAALATLSAESLAQPLGRILPIESNQAVELWIVLP